MVSLVEAGRVDAEWRCMYFLDDCSHGASTINVTGPCRTIVGGLMPFSAG